MRRITVLVLAAAVVAAAPASADPGAVHVAGHGELGHGLIVSVAASEHDDGARGWIRVDNGPGFLFVSEVRCIRSVGDRVLVGGVIVRSTNPVTIGNTSLIVISDGGPGGQDLLGSAFSRFGLDSCPVFPLPLHPVESGNFAVSD